MKFIAFRHKSAKPQGFISIIALGMFMLMMIVAMDLVMLNIDTMNNIRAANNYSTADIIATSMTQYIQLKMKSHEVGWNTEKITCGFGKYAGESTVVNGSPLSLCQDSGLLWMVNPYPGEVQKDIKIEIEVKGRLKAEEKLVTNECKTGGNLINMNNSCYVIPFPKTGTANYEKGSCKRYKPDFIDGNGTDSAYVDPILANKDTQLDQLDYSCNWNKLQFGSSKMDRVAIPLFYDQSGAEETAPDIVNPYLADISGNAEAEDFILRIRTPCVPCGNKMDNGQPRNCAADPNANPPKPKITDESVCKDNERYVLRDDIDPFNDDEQDEDDIVVQWRIEGLCEENGKDVSCGMLGTTKKGKNEFSAIYESRINDKLDDYNDKILSSEKEYEAYDAGIFSNEKTPYPIIDKLKTMKEPTLVLSLSHPLLTDQKYQFVPYLEYQLLTDKPVSNSKAIVKVSVGVGEYYSTKVLEIDVPKSLIDFAVHN